MVHNVNAGKYIYQQNKEADKDQGKTTKKIPQSFYRDLSGYLFFELVMPFSVIVPYYCNSLKAFTGLIFYVLPIS
jgi:hypothetical protein